MRDKRFVAVHHGSFLELKEHRLLAVWAASVASNAAARDSSEGTPRFIARAAGHAVATAHMADYALGAAIYSIKAVQSVVSAEAYIAADRERTWQQERLPEEVQVLVLSAASEGKFKGLYPLKPKPP